MSRLVARFCLALAVLGLALVGASPSAMAQEQLDYPGPFGSGGDFQNNETSPVGPGTDADGDGISDQSVPDGSSIDANPAGAGLSFVQANTQPSSDPDAVGGTGGGDAGAGLAVTGVESEVAMAVAMGLLTVGGATLVTSRRRLSALDH